MSTLTNKITPCLWFDHQAEEAATFYTSLFNRSTTLKISRYGKEGFEIHRQPDGSVMTVEFELGGQAFVALNGGPLFQFTEAISFQVFCEDQQEVDYFWEALTDGGDKKAQQCGWLKDKFGVSWQIIPKQLSDYIGSSDAEKSQRAVKAMLQMKKIDLAEIQKAFFGGEKQ
jgi:predicted 3-demethylubiquinone-9 3-methyltransferase (glyoxalase superfamily)